MNGHLNTASALGTENSIGVFAEPRAWRYADTETQPAAELTWLRGPSTKTFNIGGGHRQAVLFAYPVHTEENGVYADIDNTFIPDKSMEGAMVSRASSMLTSCPPLKGGTESDTDVPFASLSFGGYRLTISHPGLREAVPQAMADNGAADAVKGVALAQLREKALLRQWGGVEYLHAKAGVTLRCILCPQGFKDEWVFEYPESFPSGGKAFTLYYEAPGLKLTEE